LKKVLDGASVGGRPADRLAESGGLGRGLHRGGLRHLRARDPLTETTLYGCFTAVSGARSSFAGSPVGVCESLGFSINIE